MSSDKRVSNENILNVVNDILNKMHNIENDINEMKIKLGYNDKELMPPTKKNYNTDSGPFGSADKVLQARIRNIESEKLAKANVPMKEK